MHQLEVYIQVTFWHLRLIMYDNIV